MIPAYFNTSYSLCSSLYCIVFYWILPPSPQLFTSIPSFLHPCLPSSVQSPNSVTSFTLHIPFLSEFLPMPSFLNLAPLSTAFQFPPHLSSFLSSFAHLHPFSPFAAFSPVFTPHAISLRLPASFPSFTLSSPFSPASQFFSHFPTFDRLSL